MLAIAALWQPREATSRYRQKANRRLTMAYNGGLHIG